MGLVVIVCILRSKEQSKAGIKKDLREQLRHIVEKMMAASAHYCGWAMW